MIRYATLSTIVISLFVLTGLTATHPRQETLRGTGNLGVVVERASGSVLIIDTTKRVALARVEGLGDLSHASVVFSPDQRYAYVFGRDGGLSKIDILTSTLARRIIQAGNSIGGAISDDGTLVAVSNYEPGGVRVFDAATLELVADIPANWKNGRSKTIGLVDAPGRRFVFTLWDAGETWIADFSSGATPTLTKIGGVGNQPYDALITADGRYYLTGLFGEDGMTVFDLWQTPVVARRILADYGRGQKRLPVYKMPHLEGWALAGDRFVLPAIGRHEVLWVDARSFKELRRTRVHGQPVFAVARPDGRHVWVNFAHPRNDTIQVIDALSGTVVHEFKPGPAVLHMEFLPRGNEVWVSVGDFNVVQVYDARRFTKIAEIPAKKSERDFSDISRLPDGSLRMTDMARDFIDMRLLGDWQRDLPLVPRPFAVLAAHLETSEADVINRLKRLCRSGAVSRVGGVVRPNVIGASTLAALAAPDLQVEEIAVVIGEEPGVNHSYLRENKLNLWFVATGPDRDHVAQSLARISKRTGRGVFDLRLERSYHIDLGFPLDGRGTKHCEAIDAPTRCATFERRQGDAQLIQALTYGLPLEPDPFRSIAEALGRSEASVIARLTQLRAAEVITRLGVIVRHRALGWRSNAMVVWDVSPDGIDRAGASLAAISGVNLCYRRTRVEGDWPYNLYCMVHAKTRANALKIITQASEAARLTDCPRQILFSSRCFKQTGAMLTAPKEAA